MENIYLRIQRSTPALGSVTDVQKKILHHQKNHKKSYTTARREIFNADTPVGPSNQASAVKKDRRATEFRGSY